MNDLAPFIDIEVAVIELLTQLSTEEAPLYLGVETPADLSGHLPFIKVARIGGTDDRFTDAARIDVQYFTLSRTLAKVVSANGHQHLLAYPHSVDAGVIDRVTTDVSPNEVPWANDKIRMFTSSYRITARR
jgi:hypothetical protein